MLLPEKFEERMKDMLGGEYGAFIAALENEPPRAGIRVNTLKEDAAAKIAAEFDLTGRVPWCPTGFFADKAAVSGTHPYHAAGLFYFQEPSAMAVVEGLPIERGDFVLDLCAAPGGKATHAASKLRGSGLLAANEINAKRAAVLSGNIERMGIKNAVVTNESPETLAQKLPAFFDKIIVDAPCSGEGMFRKEPRAVTEWSAEHSASCAVRQKKIIDSAVKMLAPGGCIIYSTCTFAPEEDERIVSYMIERHSLRVREMSALSMLSEGVPEWADGNGDLRKTRRIFPHRERGEGHFIALLQKDGGGAPEREAVKAERVDLTLYREFEQNAMNITIDGRFALFGENLYLVPDGIDLRGIRVARAGLHLGVMKKNRFEPSHALAMAYPARCFKSAAEYGARDAAKYLAGEALPCGENGWCAVTYNGAVLGFGKASGGTLKNHYPKALRLRGA